MSVRKNISSGAPWEEIVGYSRAVQIGNTIEISGTTAFKDGEVVAPGDAYAQTIYICSLIRTTLEKANARLSDVIRTRIYVTDIKDWEAVGKAHGEFFRAVKPATTMVEVSRLIDDKLVVEIEATAIIGNVEV
jgi:enamine deaminase RidA (YjgF/YER057c/UK114 family)